MQTPDDELSPTYKYSFPSFCTKSIRVAVPPSSCKCAITPKFETTAFFAFGLAKMDGAAAIPIARNTTAARATDLSPLPYILPCNSLFIGRSS